MRFPPPPLPHPLPPPKAAIAAFMEFKAASILDDEFEKELDDVWSIVIDAFMALRAASTLDDEFDE